MKKTLFLGFAALCLSASLMAQDANDNALRINFTDTDNPVETEHSLLGTHITFSNDGRSMNFSTNGTTVTYSLVDHVSGMSYFRGTPAVSLTTHEDPQHAGDYYTTFYSGLEAYTIPAGVTAYTASLAVYDTETWLNLNEISGVLPQGEAVLLKTTGTAITMEATDPTSATADDTNVLNGVDVATATTSLGTIYTLASVDGEMAFYQYEGLTMPANKAYLGLPAGAPAPRRIAFGTNTATGMKNTEATCKAEKILCNGQLLIRKNGHLYNAQGAVVE